MSRTQHLVDLTRQARVRVASVEHLRAEHRIITEQSDRRLAESRALLDRALRRTERSGSVERHSHV